MNSKKKTIQANYDRLSRWYNLLSGSHEQRIRSSAMELLAVQPGEYVLEVGVGTGQALPGLLKSAGLGGMVIGVDLSIRMLAQAKKLRAGEARLIQADAALLPLATGSQAAILACFTLEIFPEDEVRPTLAEWLRVLEPGGRLCVVAMSVSRRLNAMERLYAWSARVVPDVIDCRPVDAVLLLEQGGFSLLRTKESTIWGLPLQIVLAEKPSFALGQMSGREYLVK